MSTPPSLPRRLFGICAEETSFTRRGFHHRDERARARLEQIGQTFVLGYHAALETSRVEQLAPRLAGVPAQMSGFAYEGAAMGLALLDRLTPWRRDRLAAFTRGPGAAHIYMVNVGVGWALARLRKRVREAPAGLDPLLGWLAIDGYGFHEGYFHWPRAVHEQRRPRRVAGHARHVFDQGLGRSLWFVKGADCDLIARSVARFAPDRHADLWSGVGLACAYAGGVSREDVVKLKTAAGIHHPGLAQGAVFAAKARVRAANPAPCTALACEVFCSCPVDAAAQVADDAREGLPPDGSVPAYQIWRRRIQARYGGGGKA